MNQLLLTKVQTLISQNLNMDAELITPKASFRETLAADSLDFVELIMTVTKYLDLDSVIDEEVRNIETVEQLVTYLEAHHRPKTRSVRC